MNLTTIGIALAKRSSQNIAMFEAFPFPIYILIITKQFVSNAPLRFKWKYRDTFHTFWDR